MSDQAIQAALDGHLATMSALPPVAWENMPFTPGSAAYLRVALLPASAGEAGLGASAPARFRGVYQVGISAPGGDGSGEARTIAASICAHFDRRALGAVRCRVPSCGPARPDETGRIWLPVSIPYLADF